MRGSCIHIYNTVVLELVYRQTEWEIILSDRVSGLQIPLACSEILSSIHTNEDISSRLSVRREEKWSLLRMRWNCRQTVLPTTGRRQTRNVLYTGLYMSLARCNKLILKLINKLQPKLCPRCYINNVIFNFGQFFLIIRNLIKINNREWSSDVASLKENKHNSPFFLIPSQFNAIRITKTSFIKIKFASNWRLSRTVSYHNSIHIS
jgi:hypothetical protein